MDGTREFIQKYCEEQLNEETLPKRLEGRFELLACIHVTETHASFLVRRKGTGEKYLLKRGNINQTGSLSVEQMQQARLDKAAEQPGLEAVYWTEEDKEYLLRRYIDGQNLEEYMERKVVLKKQEALGIAIQICDILMKLHHLNPPMIHRDIKPQNLILDRFGEIHLIDFEASRNFDRNKQKDTKFYGTEATAAPEQYGYAQTDARTDIYAFGKVLCYLLTGDYQIEGCEQLNGRLGAAVKKCCAFDPGKRYQAIEEVRRLLAAEQKRMAPGRREKFLRACGITAAVICIFLTGIFVGNYWTRGSISALVQEEMKKQTAQLHVQEGKNQGAQQEGQNVTEIGEDLLRRAAAASLNKQNLTEEDLKDVVRVAVIGSRVYDMTKHFELEDMLHEDENYVTNAGSGTITDISLLAKMPNLSEVYLYNQQIQDIEALAGLPIRKLYLSGNQIGDFRVIEELPRLSELCITKNPVRYLPDFTKCTRLTTLIMNEITVADLDCLRGAAVEQMTLRKLNIASGDYTFLEDLPRLNRLIVWNPGEETSEGIARLTELRDFEVFDYHRTDIEFVSSLENLRIIHIQSSYDVDLSPLERLPKLSNLGLSYPVGDISVVRNLPELRSLDIWNAEIEDLSPILDCKKIDNLCVNEEQASYLEKHNPGYSGNLSVIK